MVLKIDGFDEEKIEEWEDLGEKFRKIKKEKRMGDEMRNGREDKIKVKGRNERENQIRKRAW